jgi:hypothetical protein
MKIGSFSDAAAILARKPDTELKLTSDGSLATKTKSDVIFGKIARGIENITNFFSTRAERDTAHLERDLKSASEHAKVGVALARLYQAQGGDLNALESPLQQPAFAKYFKPLDERTAAVAKLPVGSLEFAGALFELYHPDEAAALKKKQEALHAKQDGPQPSDKPHHHRRAWVGV